MYTHTQPANIEITLTYLCLPSKSDTHFNQMLVSFLSTRTLARGSLRVQSSRICHLFPERGFPWPQGLEAQLGTDVLHLFNAVVDEIS